MSNTGPFQFRNEFYSIVPPLLRTGNGEKYEYVLQLCTDLLLEKMNQAIRIRLPGLGDASQLPYLANDRVLVQGPAEPDASFVVRLRGANQTWGRAGSARAVLEEVQAYLQNLQPGVPATNPLATIVGGPVSGVSTSYASWTQLYQGDAIGAPPTLTTVSPSNFDWDGLVRPWRSWLVLPMALVATGQSGSAAATSTASGGSYQSPGQNVSGVWVPATSGTPVNAPFLTITGLSGIVADNAGQWLTLAGSSHAGNNGTFPITQVLSTTSVIVANPSGVTTDAGPLTWSIGEYPFIGPGPVWGTPGVVFGQGELTIPAVTLGVRVGGVWQAPAPPEAVSTTISWGLDVLPDTIASIRSLVKTWKSAGTYYPHIIIAFDGGTGVAGTAYSPNSAQGSGNPDGSFGSIGQNVVGVWVPARQITSSFDCYAQGTGVAQNCSQENLT